MALINIRDKTLANHYKDDYETVWEDVRSAFTVQVATMGEASAKWLVCRSFDRIKYRIFYGNANSLRSRYKAKLAGDWAEIHRREELYKRLYKKLELDVAKTKLIDIKTTEDYEHGTSRDTLLNKNNTRKLNNRLETVGGTMITTEEIPTSPIDMLAGEFGDLPKSDFLKVKHAEVQGRREKVQGEFVKDNHGNVFPKYRTLPNVNSTTGNIIDKGSEKGKDVEKGKTFKTTKTQEQPNIAQQVAKIVQSFQMVESEFTAIIESYDCLGFYSTFGTLGGLDYDPDIGDIGYISPDKTKAGQKELAEEAKKQAEGKGKDDLQQLTQEAYDQLKKAGKPVEKSRVLENLVRRRESVKHVSEKQNQNIATLRRGLNGLIEAYWEPVLWTNLKNFDKVMNSITGFKEFKKELRNRTELIERYRRRGKRMKQVFYCLQGKAGVGKTEIATRLAKAYMRPINILGMAGQNHPKILKGMRPTLNNAKYGRVAEAFIECKWPTFKSIDELRKELKMWTNKKTKTPKALTKLEGEKIIFLEKEIEEIKEKQKGKPKLVKKRDELQIKVDNNTATISEQIRVWELNTELKSIDGKIYDLTSQAPIILLDEFEKAKDETVLYIVGQMTDKGVNWDYQDEFLETNIDLSQAIIILTSNYWHKVPDFVRSRCKRVNINLLSYSERLEILHTILGVQIRDRFYSDSDREDKWRDAMGTFTDRQIEVLKKLGVSLNSKGKLEGGDEFLRLCMTEEFGVRGSIQNLEYCLDFMELMEERGWLDDITDMKNYDKIEDLPNLDGSGVVNIHYKFRNKDYMEEHHDEITEILTFDKKRDVEIIEEERKKQGKAECVLNMVKDWQNWKGENTYKANWKPPIMPKLPDDNETFDLNNFNIGDIELDMDSDQASNFSHD